MTLADQRVARRTAALELAQKRRTQARALKDAMKEDAFNPYELIEGKGPEVLEQEVVRFLKLYRLLPMIRGIGVSKAHEIIEAFGLPPETRMGDIPQDKRHELALIVRGAREAWTAPAHEVGERYQPDGLGKRA